LGGTVGGGATGGLWSSSGTGTFAPNTTTLNAAYSPSSADISAGAVTLRLTAQPCGDATAQVVVTIGFTPAAPTTVGGGTCGPGVVGLSASGSGGTLKWYSDSGLTTLVNTGPTYGPIVNATTNYYVTVTSAQGCVSAASPVTATVYSAFPIVSAGPNQTVSSIATTIQLAGSVANVTGGTWSGGSGTFSPNAGTTNAVYTPSASELAAGSWALTLTGNSPCGNAASTVNLTFMPELSLPVDTNSSTLQISLCIQPVIEGIPFANECQNPINALMGYMTVELDDPSNPTHITLQDFQVTAMGPYVLSYSWSIPTLGTVALSATIGTLDQPASVHDTQPGTGTPAPINPDGSFTLANVPLTSSGLAYYGGTASGSLDLSAQTTVSALPGTIHITNEVATVHMEFSFTTNLSVSFTNGIAATINADGSFNGVINAVGETTVPRYMIWNNGAGTGNWNTNDLNWNNGSAKWDNERGAKDCAIFGASGIGTVNLSQPVTAASLYFQSPGYTITGSSLALANTGAITNDADAVISGAIVSGTLNKWGPAMLTLSGANTYSGGTVVNAGVLRISSDAALGAVPGVPATNVTLNGGQLLNNSSPLLAPNRVVLLGGGGGYVESVEGSTFTVNGPITGAGGLGVVWDSGTVVLGGVNNYAGVTTIGVSGNAYNNSAGANPTLQLGSSSALPGTDLIFGTDANANTATLDLHGFSGTVAALTGGANAIVDISGGGAGTLSVGNNGASSTFGGIIRNTGGTVSLNKIGSGTLTLSGANTFTGTATVSAGTLALSSSGSLAGPVSIGAGGIFDVSTVGSGTYSPPSGAAIGGSGTASPATLKGASGGIVNLGSDPIVLAYDGSNPALTISQGALSLNGNTITVNAPSNLGEGTYPLIQVTGGTLLTNGTFTVNGTAIARGYRPSLSVSGGQLILNIVRVSTPSFTTAGPFAPSQTYGSVSLGATVSPSDATGIVTFYDGSTPVGAGTLDGTTGTATCTPAASLLSVVGSPHQITASYVGDFVYAGSSSSVSNLTITARAVTLGGSKTYDGTTTITPAAGLSLVNNVDGANLYLSPSFGSALLTGKNTPSASITSIITTNLNYATLARVQTATGTAGVASSSTTVNLSSAPVNGNTLVAVICISQSSSGGVSGISQSGVTWSKAATVAVGGGALGSGADTEIWYAPVGSGAGTGVKISYSALYACAATVIEYSGLVAASPLDQTATSTGGSSPAVTGTTATTSQANELWVGGVSYENSSSLTGIQNGFTIAANTSERWFNLLGTEYYITAQALDKAVSTTGGAYTGGNLGLSTSWSAAIATFKVASYYTYTTNLSLAGSAAPNYTLIPSGTVTVAPTNLTVTATTNTKSYDGTTSAAAHPTITTGSIQPGDTAPVWTETYANQNAATGKTLTPAALTVADGNGGANYSYTYAQNYTGVITGQSSSTFLVSAINPSGLTSNVTFTVTVTGVPSLALPTGNVIFSANSTPFATNALISGSITASTAALPVGHTAITAQYVGDGAFPASSSSSLDQVVTNGVIYSKVNQILSISNKHNGTFTLTAVGTPGAQYYVVASGDLKAHMAAWIPVVGSTNTASSSGGTWSCVVSNPTPAYYRPIAVNPAP
jgi:autotransporter-associated beta strand protein